MQIIGNSRTIDHRSNKVQVSLPSTAGSSQWDDVLAFDPLRSWLERLEEGYELRSISVRSIVYRSAGGAKPERVAFLTFDADIVNRDGKQVGGTVFMRGGSVVILVVFECEGKLFSVVCRQHRAASAVYLLPELPAGTMDSDGSFKGRAATELEEELGLKIREDDLVCLSDLAYPGTVGVFASPGACDEYFSVMLYYQVMTPHELDAMNGRRTGLADEGEFITTEVLPLERVWLRCPDAKTLVALKLFDELGETATRPTHFICERDFVPFQEARTCSLVTVTVGEYRITNWAKGQGARIHVGDAPLPVSGSGNAFVSCDEIASYGRLIRRRG